MSDPRLPVHWARAGEWQNRPMLAIANGAGAARAHAAVIAAPVLRAVISIGYCGALDPALRVADVFVATEIATKTMDGHLPCALPSCSAGSAATGPIVSTAAIAVSAAAKRLLRKKGAQAVEMEAAGAYRAAEVRGVPFYCIRAVSDLADEDLGIDFNLFLMPDGRFNTRALIAHALLNPLKRFGELIRLSRRTSLASERLGDFLARCDF